MTVDTKFDMLCDWAYEAKEEALAYFDKHDLAVWVKLNYPHLSREEQLDHYKRLRQIRWENSWSW